MKDPILSVNRYKINNVNSKLTSNECHFCKIDIKEFGKVLHRENEILSTCSMCYYTENLDSITSLKKGYNALIPELTQVKIFSLLRMSWYLDSLEDKIKNTKYEEIIDSNDNFISLFYDRKDFASNYYAEGIENVDIVVNSLHQISEDDYLKREKGLLYIRWIPDKNIFKEEIDYWNKNVFNKYTPNKFKDLIKKTSSAIVQRRK
jgi:hypothetical protein